MAKERTKCRKCGKYMYCDNHHILPKEIFGEGETENLCKNCHDEFHRALGYKYLRKDHKKNMEFYLEKYFRWLAGLAIVTVLLFFLI